MWTAADISIAFDDDMTNDPIVRAEKSTPMGPLQVMAEVRRVGRKLKFVGLHVHGDEGMINANGHRAVATDRPGLARSFGCRRNHG